MDWEKILQMMQLTRAEFIKCTNSLYNQQQNNKEHHQKMGRIPKQTFLQRRQMAKQAHEKMVNIANYQRHANHSYNEVTPQTGQNGHH